MLSTSVRCLTASLLATLALAGEGFTSLYTRPDRSAALPLSHERLVGSQNDDPEQVHIALAGEGEMTVSWVTPNRDVETDTRVHYWLDQSNQDVREGDRERDPIVEMVAFGNNETYSCGDQQCPSGYTSGVVHHAILKGLLPTSTYTYRIGGSERTLSFKTAPEPGPNVPFKYTLVGDLGQTWHSLITVEHMKASSVDGLIMHIGDLSYADGYQPRWDTYGRLVEHLAARVPWMTTCGNHEVEQGVGPLAANNTDLFLAYNTRYHMPPLADPSQPPADLAAEGPNNNFYRLRHGSTLWLMLGSYVDFTEGSTQYKWLQAELAAVDRAATPWVFVGSHAPWYNSNTVHANEYEGEGMRKVMERLLYDAGVDLVFHGHVHSYERSFPSFNLSRDKCGLTYIVIGDGGNREGIAAPWAEPQPEWSAFREGSFGHGTVEVVNSTHAVWRWMRNKDGMADVADELWLDKTQRSATCSSASAKSKPSTRLGLTSQSTKSNKSKLPRSLATE
uniref:Purple acid phosphatase n=1 Tax=Pyramimonas obovata TaxID=1411642 RepID=A0A7S0WT41_9CHLO|mmetsp:Transcript_38790/g.84406  ORF Transcript_38790/g.84406 Transcript_38790/m.84406 type:complete len:505 (+) Transcript_38790:209-1723(+)|eukprot:CAMPEP_0118928796 /NCGR_PEP_ID=MMETSP1169-20130426/5956_1 /TAXON_ID=36882 /ORGANISM="Pyramimonas obovata, Strain CCMP722" /LENGTH=504 /DNA_ID=CAMNT_0006870853 /DNA_START=183 /DNA_END=1697 /DNA_ORIENTATION=-